jgi:PKD repeat protein
MYPGYWYDNPGWVRLYIDDQIVYDAPGDYDEYLPVSVNIAEWIGTHVLSFRVRGVDEAAAMMIKMISAIAPDGPIIPVAAFHATPLSGVAPLQVQFTDDSTNTPTSWIWDFGAGILSDIQNPLVTYLGAGTYTVKLIATNAAGSDQETKTDYIAVAPPIPRYKPSWSLNICTPT